MGAVLQIGPGEQTNLNRGPISEQKLKNGNLSSAILGSPVRVRVPLELDSANLYSFRPKRDLEAVTYIARHASQGELLAEQSVLC